MLWRVDLRGRLRGLGMGDRVVGGGACGAGSGHPKVWCRAPGNCVAECPELEGGALK